MTDKEKLSIGLRVALRNLESALDASDFEDMQSRAISAANGIIDSAKPGSIAMQESRCPWCDRRIVERDPVFQGYCSTICREAKADFIRRGVRLTANEELAAAR